MIVLIIVLTSLLHTMHLLNLTLSPPTSISTAIVGSFSGTKGQEILAVRGSTKLEILKLNASTGHRESPSENQLTIVDTICSTEVDRPNMIAHDRYLVSFEMWLRCAWPALRKVSRLVAQLTPDFILLSSDSGRLSIIEFVVSPTPHFESLYQEVFGKSGSR